MMHPPRKISTALLSLAPKVKLPEGVPQFMYITQNDFVGQKCRKLKDEDISACECKYDASNPESACGESCLNVLTNTECTPGYCPSAEHCRNQKFQKCEYAKTKLFKTEGRGWGLTADEDIKAGQFIIEYCGEVITSDEAAERSHTYESLGLKDAYIISLNASYYIDATKKGSLARFINHSCNPNCETRKWTVLGETRVGIYAKVNILVGTELAYDYNFEWYGGANVRCLCGANNCSLFLGAKSQGFQEYNHVWEDGDDRYTVENVPLYDSGEDAPFTETVFITNPIKQELQDGGQHSCSVESGIKKEPEVSLEEGTQFYSQTNAMISRIRSNSTCRNYNIGPSPNLRKKIQLPRQKAKISCRKYVSSKPITELFTSKEIREEITRCEELKNKANAELNSLYDEIRPAIEEHEKDSQDSVCTSVAEKWINTVCAKWQSEFEFHFCIVRNAICPPKMNYGHENQALKEVDDQKACNI